MEIAWEPESYRSDKLDTISGSFRPGNPAPRFRRLSLISVPGERTGQFKVRLEVCASRGMPRDSQAWKVRCRELHESARTLSWMNDDRRQQPDEILHEFVADLSGIEILACGRPLEHLLTEGLLAYALAFREYLAREN